MIWLTSPVTTPPVWLRIAWYNGGNQTYPSYSSDGINWQTVYCGGDGCSFNISSPVYAGVAVTSHDNGTLTTSHIEGLSLLAAPWTSADIGATGITGNAVVNDATGASYTIQGAGADIWGTVDAFQFVYQRPGNVAIQMRVASEQATDPFAKVGVMIRSSLTANAAFVILDMKPSGELEFMQRATDGDYVNYLGGAAPGFTWIQLVRQDSTITVSASTDGSAWTQVGTTSVTFGFTGALGIAVTSHDTSQLNTSTVDNVVVK